MYACICVCMRSICLCVFVLRCIYELYVSNKCASTHIAVFLYAYTWEGQSLTSCIFLYHLSTIAFEQLSNL